MSASFTVLFLKSGVTLYAFPTPTPFVTPQVTPDYDNFEPPRLSSILKTWEIEGIFYGKDGTTSPQWTALVAALTNPTNQPDEVRIVQGASTIIDSITAGSGYGLFKIEALQSPRSDNQWRGEMRFKVRVSGRKLFVLVGIGSGITKLEYRDAWSYSAEGLLTRTVSGRIQTVPGTSAFTQAMSAPTILGVTLPSSAYGWLTNGPTQTDAQKQNDADTDATFTISYSQSGVSLPAQTAPDYDLGITVSTAGGETSTVTTVTARGVGAAAAVLAAAPAGTLVSRSVRTSAPHLTASASYVTKDTLSPGTSYVLTRAFQVVGGGKPVRFTLRTGGRDPAGPHTLPRNPVTITETLVCIYRGALSGAFNLGIPAPLEIGGLFEDTDAMSAGPFWNRDEPGLTSAGDRWRLQLTRVYRAASITGLDDLLMAAATDLADRSSNISAEFNRKV